MLDLIAGDRSTDRLPTTGGGPARPTGDDDTTGIAAVADPAENRSAAAGGNHDERSADNPAIGAAGKDINTAAVDAAGVPVKHPETDAAATTVVDIEPTDAAAAGGTAAAVSGQLADRGASRIAPRPATGRGRAGARQATDTGTAETGAEKIVAAGERVGVFQASAHSPRLSKNRSAGSPIPPGSIAATLRLSSRSAVTAEQE